MEERENNRTPLRLVLHHQKLNRNSVGYKEWKKETNIKEILAEETAVIISDMWDRHWSQGAEERGVPLAKKINHFIKAARDKGVQIIHAPSDTMAFYKEHSARLRLLNIPTFKPPAAREIPDPPQPIDSSDGGSDTGETQPCQVWSRQSEWIEIDELLDVITGDEGERVYSFLQHKGIKNLIYVGVHTNMCVLNRSFGIKQMSRWGVPCILIKELTDAMYNPAMPPYVSHEEGTRLIVEYIEKFWCPTAESLQVIQSLHEF